MLDLIIKNGECYIDGKLTRSNIGIQNGKISTIGDLSDEQSKEIIDASNLLVLPGCMDTQVHFREPGSTNAEDLHTGSKAAIAGGIPIVKAVRENLRLNKISKIYGILNGTCNYILTKMENNAGDFKNVLNDAQKKGFSWLDPTIYNKGIYSGDKKKILLILDEYSSS